MDEDNDLQELIQKQESNDRIPSANVSDVDIPDEELSERCMLEWKNDIMDKDQGGWTEKRVYDDKAYYEIKDPFMTEWPWPNASAFPVSMTQVFVDTLHSTVDDLYWRKQYEKIVTVSPVSDEDTKKSKNLEMLLNWQGINDIVDFQQEDSASNFFMIQKGTGFLKVLDVGGNDENGKPLFKLGAFNIKPEYIYMPVNSRGCAIGKSESVTQLIPLSSNDMRQRIDTKVYRNLDKVGKGFMPANLTKEELDQIQKEVTGLDNIQKARRDTFWICEKYWTYYPKGSLKPVELIVWFSPMTGAILRKIRNTEGIRPIVDKFIYENYEAPFHRSLPEKIRHIQEKANYTDKQATDGMEKAIHRAGFYTGNSGFDPKMSLRAPLGMYKVKNLGTVQWEPVDISAILAQRQELVRLWLEGERVSGVTDLQQAIVTRNTAPTLGQDQMRAQRSDVRFSKIRRNVSANWKRTWDTIYQYDDLYMPREKKVGVLGMTKFESIDKLFPAKEGTTLDKGLGGIVNVNFGIANKPIQEQEQDDQKRSVFMGEIIQDPMFGQDKGTRYRAYEQRAEANKIFDFEDIVPRPSEASVLTPDEVIDRIMDGEQVEPDPNVNPNDYINAIKLFMRSGNFKESKDIQSKKNLAMYLLIMKQMQDAQKAAFKNFKIMNMLTQPQGEPKPEAKQAQPNVQPNVQQ